MNGKGRDYAEAIEREVAEFWPGVTVEFVEGGMHPKAKFTFDGKILSRPFAGTSSDSAFGVHRMLGDMRRVMKQLGAERSKPESKEEDEARYNKPNPGKEKRPDPVAREPVVQQDPKAPLKELADKMPAQQAEPKASVLFPVDPFAGDEPDTEEEGEAEAEALPTEIEDGIYFRMPDTHYHAIHRYSTSGIQWTLISPATFWEQSWFNINKPPKEEDEKETAARITGRAYHVARLEPHLFEQLYRRALNRKDFPKKGTVYTGDHIGTALAAMGETKKRSGESVLDQANRLAGCGYDGVIWPVLEAQFQEECRAASPRPIVLPPKIWDDIVRDMERIRANPQIAEHLVGGQAEVSVFWTDQRGIKMKCRFDYLKPTEWSDFKTFANSQGKHLMRCLSDAFQYNRYYIQMAVYRDAAELIRAGVLPVMGDATAEERELVELIASNPVELDCWYVFQEKAGIPNVMARRVKFWLVPVNVQYQHAGATQEGINRVEEATRQMSRLFAKAVGEIDKAKGDFLNYQEIFPLGEPWFPINAVGDWDDEDFNNNWLEGR